MKIMFLCFIPIMRDVGGIQKVTDSLAGEFMRRGHDIIFVHYEWRDIPPDYPFTAPQHFIDTRNDDRKQWVETYHRLLRQQGTEVVINLTSSEVSYFLLSHTPQDIKRITTNHLQPFAGLDHLHESSPLIPGKTLKRRINRLTGTYLPFVMRPIYARREKANIDKILRVSDRYCVLCEEYIKRIIRFHPNVDKSKLCFIPNPTPYSDATFDSAGKQNILLYVGRLSNYPKNLIAFVRVWHRLSQANPDWKAVVVGEGSVVDRAIKPYVKSKQIPRIYFEGFQKDVTSYYESAKFVCVTSFFEAWNMSLIEGMSFGCIPVAFDSYEGARAIISHEKDGILVRPFDEKLMASAIQQLIDHPEKMRQMSQAAKEKTNTFSLQSVADSWESLINSI